jgi:hypothetical protein
MQLKKVTFSALAVALYSMLLSASGKKNDTGSNGGTPTPDPLAALNLPATPFNDAMPPLPFYFQSPGIIQSDNTPAANPVTD